MLQDRALNQLGDFWKIDVGKVLLVGRKIQVNHFFLPSFNTTAQWHILPMVESDGAHKFFHSFQILFWYGGAADRVIEYSHQTASVSGAHNAQQKVWNYLYAAALQLWDHKAANIWGRSKRPLQKLSKSVPWSRCCLQGFAHDGGCVCVCVCVCVCFIMEKEEKMQK